MLEKILIIDDDITVCELLQYHLTREGYLVKWAGSGEEGLRDAQRWTPNLIVLDIKLPGMSGFEACRQLRQIEATARVPIILISAKLSSIEAKKIGFQAGADDYITKPFDIIELILRIKAQLRRMRVLSGAAALLETTSDAESLAPVDNIPGARRQYTNQRIVKAIGNALRKSNSTKDIEYYLMLAGLGHLSEPELANLPYQGPDIFQLPNLSEAIKTDAFNILGRKKRAFDLIVSLTALIALSPLLLILMLAVYLRLGSPIFFRQERPGLNGEPFWIIKFRTMTNETGATGQLLPDEKRMTAIGSLLRRASLDELPELLNVISTTVLTNTVEAPLCSTRHYWLGTGEWS